MEAENTLSNILNYLSLNFMTPWNIQMGHVQLCSQLRVQETVLHQVHSDFVLGGQLEGFQGKICSGNSK